MKVECVGCKKAIDEQDFGSCHSVYKCRKEHIFACCRADCLRTFEKKCAKVAEFVRKTHNKLNNDGHTSALRRMPPGERDKYKQLNEAEANGLMICPEEIKAGDRCVPYCSHCVLRTGGTATLDEDDSSNTLRREESDSFKKDENNDKVMKELVTDDMLVEFKRDEDSFLGGNTGANTTNNAPTTTAKPTKTTGKGRKEQKGRQIDLKGLLGGAVLGQDPAPPAVTAGNAGPVAASAPANPWQRGTANSLAAPAAWAQTAAVVARLPADDKDLALQAGRKDPPPDAVALKRNLMELTACTEARAAEVLAQHGWNLEHAADSLFQNVGTFAERAAAAAAKNNEARSQPRAQQPTKQQRQPAAAAQAAQTAQQQSAAQAAQTAQGSSAAVAAAAQQTQAPAQAGVAEGNDDSSQGVQPPGNPPPPQVPEGWQAVWCDVQKEYYFWHIPTNETTWDPPEVSESEVTSEPEESKKVETPPPEEPLPQPQVEQQQQQQPQQQTKPGKKFVPSEPSPGPSPKSNGAVQPEANEPRLDPAAAAQQEFLRRLELSSATSFTTTVPESTVGGWLEQPALTITPEDASPTGQAESISGATTIGMPEGQYCCCRHWRPRDDLPECLRLIQGERMEVSWSEPSEDGWAYGFALEDSAHPGYFPQAVLRAPMRQPVPRIVGEHISVANTFAEPEHISGYLPVTAGEIVRVLHPTQDPHVWVFVERVVPGPHGRREAGWIPEDLLSDLPEKSR